MNPVQRSTLKKAAVWLATLLVVLQCGGLAVSGILTLASIPVSLFAGLDEGAVIAVVITATLFACCQVLAVWQRSMALSFIVGLALTTLGFVGLACGCLLPFAKGMPSTGWGVLLAIVIHEFVVGT